MTPLLRYLTRARLTPQDFHRSSGIDYGSVWRLCHTRRIPTLRMAVRIEKATGGAVKPLDWLKRRAA
jgi:plasmid maintenance system antidote protein VapI